MSSTNNKIGLLIAMEVESQGLFEKAKIPVHFCGVGKVNATFKVTEMILKNGYTHILNLGTAGSHQFATHEVVECSGFVQRDMDLSPLGFPRGETPVDPIPGLIKIESFYTALPRGVCGTGDSFEVGKPKVNCDLVDMEAYAIAKVCKKLGVGLTSVKYISDGSDHNAHNDWAGNLPKAAKKLLEIYQEIVGRMDR